MIARRLSIGFVVTAALLAAVRTRAVERPLGMVVMDPLAAQLSCPCVEGHAQRDYDQLAAFIEESLGRAVEVSYSSSLGETDAGKRPAEIVIGKRSVVEAEAKAHGRRLVPIAALTDKAGDVTQRGLVVVHSGDASKTLADLAGHRVLLGPEACEEKHEAAVALFTEHGITVDPDGTISENCDDAVAAMLEDRKKGIASAAIVSSYAQPLLEGCGKVKRGEVRVLGQTRPVPFIVAFAEESVDADTRARIVDALLAVAKQPLLKLALESRDGFVPLDEGPRAKADGKTGVRNGDWPGWRGPERDGLVRYLPATLPDGVSSRWTKLLFNEGLGGVAVADGVVLVGDRDSADSCDVFHAFDADSGERLWTLEYPAEGMLDYGNSPRATPLVHGKLVYLLGAFGHLHCVRLDSGAIVWQRHLRDDFGATDDLVWGCSASPLIVGERLIVNPGGPSASLVALDPATGDVLWKTSGPPAAFSSFIVRRFDQAFQGRVQLVGFDRDSLGGWDVATGERLWTLPPKVPGDFNVPTPVGVNDGIVVTTENNGTRLLAFDGERPGTRHAYPKLAPDMHTPVVTAGRLFGVHDGKVHCLDATTLAPLWTAFDRSLKGHVSLVASDDRVLMLTPTCELVLIDALADELRILSRRRVIDGDASTYSHPAVAQDAVFVRGPGKLVCMPILAN